MTDASTGLKVSGILIRVREVGASVGRIEREHSSYVDYDEISSFIKGIEHISKLELSAVTSLDNFRAEYRTKGDLLVATFSSPGPAPAGVRALTSVVTALVESGQIGKASCALEMQVLRELREGVIKAQTKLDSLKQVSK